MVSTGVRTRTAAAATTTMSARASAPSPHRSDRAMLRPEDQGRPSGRIRPANANGRAAAAHHARGSGNGNGRPLALLLSLLLASVAYYLTVGGGPFSSSWSSSRGARRHGLGAGDTRGELTAALRRRGDGRAAVAVIRVAGADGGDPGEVRYLVQVKSHDYPIEAFRGTVCLLGGNANKNDATPLDTLLRELNEELRDPDWVAAIDAGEVIDDSAIRTTARPYHNASDARLRPGAVRYLGTTLHFQSADLLHKPNPYAFLCALYEVTLRPDQLPPSAIYPRGANIREGRVVLLTEDQLVRHSRYAWGYEHTMESYFGRRTTNKQRGTAVSVVDEDTWRETVWTPEK